jgi:hypothetical protein
VHDETRRELAFCTADRNEDTATATPLRTRAGPGERTRPGCRFRRPAGKFWLAGRVSPQDPLLFPLHMSDRQSPVATVHLTGKLWANPERISAHAAFSRFGSVTSSREEVGVYRGEQDED